MLYVTNRTYKALTDGWNGMRFYFPTNERVPIPPEAAAHIFGFGLPDRSHAWRRQGFVNEQDGQEFLKGFKFSEESETPAVEAAAVEPEVKASAKSKVRIAEAS